MPSIVTTEQDGLPSSGYDADSARASRLDSVDISLLTCGPGQEVWSLYGHTALRIHDRATGQDMAANWGLFSLGKDYFVLRFVFGLTDYQMGIAPMSAFLDQYQYEGRWVKEQRLKLTVGEKQHILEAIERNYRPENREYRYNFFYDNCTTRARDIIFSATGKEKVDLSHTKRQHTSYREEIHRWNEAHRWARFGNDLLLGIQADRAISQEEAEFLPTNLMNDIDHALSDTASYLVLPRNEQTASDESHALVVCPTPQTCLMAACAIIFLLSLWESEKHKNLYGLDILLLALTGVPGLILLAMVFSQHPTVQVNLQILLLNPLNLVFLWPATKRLRQGKSYWYGHLVAVLAIVALIINTFKIQVFAEGMEYLALSLLFRYAVMLAKERQRKMAKAMQDGKGDTKQA